MAKMTLSDLATFTKSYVDAAKQAGSWSATTNNFAGLLDKIGKQVTINGLFNDKLPELNGDDLPLGKTIEEYYIDLTLPQVWGSGAESGESAIHYEGSQDVVPALPSVEDVAYCYTLGRNKIKTTVPYDNFERAMLSSEGAGNMAANIMEKLQNSYDLTRFACKKQLLGNAIIKAIDANEVVEIAKPVDDTTGEAFIKQVKEDVETASFPHEGGLKGALIGAAPSLVMYIKKGVMPSIEVDTLAGAFNQEKLAMGVEVKVVDDFGTLTGGAGASAFDYSDAYALLVDPRAIKLHNGYTAVREAPNADGDFINYVRHFEDTGFISKYAFVKAYRVPQD